MNRLRASLQSLKQDLRLEFEKALDGTYTSKQVAGSFALGVFITSLPTLGVGVLLFFVIAHLFASVSRLALFSSVLVLNPAVKWGVYGSSFWLGSLLLGPVEGVTRSDISLSAAPEVVVRLLVGNLIIAVVLTIGAYAFAYWLTAAYRRRNGEVGPIEGAVKKVRDPPER